MNATEQKFADGAQQYLEDGEEVLVACIAQAKGYTKMMVSGLDLGRREVGRSSAAAKESEVKVDNPMALVLTEQRLLTLKIGMPIGLGIGGKVKELLTAIPLSEVDSIAVKKIALRQNVTVTVRGVEIPLETNAKASAKEQVERFEQLKAAV